MSGKAVRETLGFLAVVAGLVFVGLEIRQNTAAVRGATMQAISDASVQLTTDAGYDSTFVDLFVRMFNGETYADFTAHEAMKLQIFGLGFLRNLENTYFQHREGLVTEAVFDSYGWHDATIRTVWFRDFWELRRDLVVSAEFIEFFESRAQIGPTP